MAKIYCPNTVFCTEIVTILLIFELNGYTLTHCLTCGRIPPGIDLLIDVRHIKNELCQANRYSPKRHSVAYNRRHETIIEARNTHSIFSVCATSHSDDMGSWSHRQWRSFLSGRLTVPQSSTLQNRRVSARSLLFAVL